MLPVRSASLHGFADLVTSLGGDPAAIVGSVGLPVEALHSNEVRVPLETMAEAVELAARQLSCADLGLRLAGYQGPPWPSRTTRTASPGSSGCATSGRCRPAPTGR